ncbi:hypothetical protein [uncultured Granulicatella sp.]|uniref:hypothetical protein n=1 Tax=uncultured Granulicatella sp. TaxID=316089 RepID=UPI0028DD0FD1|nr:hypothetical protein [uncultured Granulicatella sp.]
MRKDENSKEKQVNITGRTIWAAVLIINVILILIKLFNVFYFKHSFGEEFNYTYFMSLFPTFFLFAVTASTEKEKSES